MGLPLLPIFFILLAPFSSSALLSSSSPQGYLVDCGAAGPHTDERGRQWVPDAPYASGGAAVTLSSAPAGLSQVLYTSREFRSPGKSCFVFPAVVRGARYLVRPTYYYYGAGEPPVFDQMVDGTFWTAVNTTADFAAGMASVYEGVFQSQGRTMTFCLAANAAYTHGREPFISALEVVMLDDSVYNATRFDDYAMGLIARARFGGTASLLPERYPDDMFDRYWQWQPLVDGLYAVNSTHNVTASDFWNVPPVDLFNTALVAEKGRNLILQWPPLSLQNSSYYVALYFADVEPGSLSRAFDIDINDYKFYKGLTVTSSGISVFATEWILSGQTIIKLTPLSTVPPMISAGEVFGLFPVGRLTYTRDVLSLRDLRRTLTNPPADWNGDPCMPMEYSWTGVTCDDGPRIRVISLNLSSMGLSGSLPPSIANLTALVNVSFSYNNLSGTIPDLSRLQRLEILHLDDNQFSGTIPQSLGTIQNLHELFLQNNNLGGKVPQALLNKHDLTLKLRPGNNFSLSPTPPNPSGN